MGTGGTAFEAQVTVIIWVTLLIGKLQNIAGKNYFVPLRPSFSHPQAAFIFTAKDFL